MLASSAPAQSQSAATTGAIEFNGRMLDAQESFCFANWRTGSVRCRTGTTGTTPRAAPPVSGAGRQRLTSAPDSASAARCPPLLRAAATGESLVFSSMDASCTRWMWRAFGASCRCGPVVTGGTQPGTSVPRAGWCCSTSLRCWPQQQGGAGKSYYRSNASRGESTYVGKGCAAVHGRLRSSDEGSSYSYYVGC